jgi:putative transposase
MGGARGAEGDRGRMCEKYAFSERRACGLMRRAVTTYRYRSQRSDEPLRTKLVELVRKKPRFGYRRLHVLLRRDGERVHHKRLHRIYCGAELRIRRKKRKHCVREGKPLLVRTAANQGVGLGFCARCRDLWTSDPSAERGRH